MGRLLSSLLYKMFFFINTICSRSRASIATYKIESYPLGTTLRKPLHVRLPSRRSHDKRRGVGYGVLHVN